jgi:hypothetical protein
MSLTNSGQLSVGMGVPASTLHIYENTSNTTSTAGLTIEQDGTGDAMLQFLLTATTRWTMGIDNSLSGDPFVIAPSNLSTGALWLNTAGQMSIGLPDPGSSKLLVATDGSDNSIWLESYGTTNVPSIRARAARGLLGAPTASQNGDVLMILQGGGYYTSGGTGYGDTASMSYVATQNHTASARGTKISFQVTPDFGTSRSPVFEILQDGGLIAPNVYGHTTSVIPNMTIESDGRIRRTTHVNSSVRYKKDVRYLDGTELEPLFSSLRPISYRSKEGDNSVRYGLLAEDVYGAGGQAFVQLDLQGRPDILMYDRLIVPTIATVQHLMGRVNELEQMVSDLQARLN